MEKEKTEKNTYLAFICRRLHSLTGIFLSLFLFEHLLTNSQAALWFGDDGIGFVRMVNFIHSLPYLPLIEIGLLAIPFIIHMIWGVMYLKEARYNSVPSLGATPALSFARNHNYSWQRWSAWLLLFGVLAHIIHMRVIHHPVKVEDAEGNSRYVVAANFDPGLYTLAPRLGLKIIDEHELVSQRHQLERMQKKLSLDKPLRAQNERYDAYQANWIRKAQTLDLEYKRLQVLEELWDQKGNILLEALDFGHAALMLVRESFKNPILAVLYSIYVLAAVFHACNGLWSAAIVWGFTQNSLSQRLWMLCTRGLILSLSVLGLCAIWLSYYVNLRG